MRYGQQRSVRVAVCVCALEYRPLLEMMAGYLKTENGPYLTSMEGVSLLQCSLRQSPGFAVVKLRW